MTTGVSTLIIRPRKSAIPATCASCRARGIFTEKFARHALDCHTRPGSRPRASPMTGSSRYPVRCGISIDHRRSRVLDHPLSRMMTAMILSQRDQRPPMQTPPEILADLWTSAGGDPSALDAVTLTGEEPQLPSSFRVGVAAQASIAAAALAAAQLWKLRSGQSQDVAVDMRHAVVECRSERYLGVDGKPPPPAWDAIAGVYRTGDQRVVRLHTNFPHHRAAVRKVLGCKPERADVQAALMQWDGEAFETAAYAAGGVVAMMRSYEEWSALPQAKALAALPTISIEKVGEAPPRPWPAGDRPLAGLRVLDLSRVIAGPVAGRALAAHGADVLLISGPDLPAIPWLTIDTGRGKLTGFVELKTGQGREVLRDLLAQADIFSQVYRPHAP